MALILDSGAVYALYDSGDKHHAPVKRVIDRERSPFVIPAATLAEIDYLLSEFLGTDAELDFLDALSDGFYALEPPTAEDLGYCRRVISDYRDLKIGLADASVMALAERLNVNRILTVDLRDFRAVKPKKWPAFHLLLEGK